MPLANKYRPQSFDEMVGQEHIVGPNGVLRKLAQNKTNVSVILYGPPGTGKSTTALIYAKALNKELYSLNAVNASVKDIKGVVDKNNGNGVVLYLDEIQYFNKKQQQSLLPYIESGEITLIAATTENPYHEIYDALLSRCVILEFKRPTPKEITSYIEKIAQTKGSELYGLNPEVYTLAAKLSSGDVRSAITDIEMMLSTIKDPKDATVDDLLNIKPSVSMAGFDKNGNSHYEYVSALQKSIRGSDPDASVFWLSKLLEGGDIISPCRRLPAICCEDIGLANPDAIVHTMACCDAAEKLGLPEAYKPLTQAVLYLALAPKSASNERTWMSAQDDIRNGLGATTPKHLRSSHAPGYLWAHQFPNHWVNQQYLPDDIEDKKYYIPDDNPMEQQAKQYWENIKANKL